MPNVTALFCDIGGVLLSNAWDKASRQKAAGKYRLDWGEFEERHELVVNLLETGQIGLDEYMERTVFHCPRTFTKQDFRDFVFAQSQAYPEAMNLIRRLAQSKRYLLATLNNESLDLNLYRIQQFRLRDYFSVFFSSCFVGVRKPDEAIYRMALQMTQRSPEESVFVDDRLPNLEPARRCGMRTIHYQSAAQLQHELRELSIEII